MMTSYRYAEHIDSEHPQGAHVINLPPDNPAAAPVPAPFPGVRITAGPGPFDATITANGVDISRAVAGADIQLRAGWPPEVELTLNLADITTYAEPGRVQVPESTRNALIALGWTPPADTQDGPF
jgi:hypothetical protein